MQKHTKPKYYTANKSFVLIIIMYFELYYFKILISYKDYDMYRTPSIYSKFDIKDQHNLHKLT